MTKRSRTSLIVPKTPGGHLDNPPSDCPFAVGYCPDPEKYERVMIVDYVLCSRATNKNCRVCPRKLEADRGRRNRIRLVRGNEYDNSKGGTE